MANTVEQQPRPAEVTSHDGHAAETLPPKKKPTPVLNAIIILIVLAILLAIGIIPRIKTTNQIDADAKTTGASRIRVQTIHAKLSPATDTVDLPGNIEATRQSSVNARATGYLKQWFVDIGDHVTQGQILATIETPDQDQELLQARAELANSQAAKAQADANLIAMVGNLDQAKANDAKADASLAQAVQQVAQQKSDVAQAQQAQAQQEANLAQAVANRDLAKITAARYQNLVDQKAIAQQTADQENVAYTTAQATVQADQASVGAAKANVAAIESGVAAAQSNVTAYRDALYAAKSSVDTAVADVNSSRANVVAAQANVNSSQANLAREAVLTAFQNVTAPFSGVVTARNVDDGDLINSGSSSSTSDQEGSGSAGANSSGSAASGGLSGSNSSSTTGSSSTSTSGGSGAGLFSIAQLNKVRIYVNVPQEDVNSVLPGIVAHVHVRELPSRTFNGAIVRSAFALDPSSRTLVAEVDLDNPGEILRPGMFADVQFDVKEPAGVLLIPDSAMISNGSGTQAATVTSQGTVHLVDITIGRDFGQVMQVLSGLTRTEDIIDNPPDGTKEGEKVTSVAEKSRKTPS